LHLAFSVVFRTGNTGIEFDRAGVRGTFGFCFLAGSLLSIRPVGSRPPSGYCDFTGKRTQKAAGLSTVWDKKFRDLRILEYPNSNV